MKKSGLSIWKNRQGVLRRGGEKRRPIIDEKEVRTIAAGEGLGLPTDMHSKIRRKRGGAGQIE